MRIGYLDTITKDLVRGWAQEDTGPSKVELYINHIKQTNDQIPAYRHDLVAAGRPGDAGFAFAVAGQLSNGDVVDVMFEGGGSLEGSPRQFSAELPRPPSVTIDCPIFLHIPKTGGSAIYELICKHSQNNVPMNSGTIGADIANLRTRQTQPDLIFGHLSHGVHTLIDAKPKYITLVREPIARVVSCYRYNRSIPWSPYRNVRAFKNSIKDFVENCVTEETNNHMCRIIAGVPNEVGMNISDPWLLDLAISNIEKNFILIGVANRMEDFATHLGKALGWKENFAPHKANVTIGQDLQLDKDTLATLTAFNSLDIKLFDHINEMLVH